MIKINRYWFYERVVCRIDFIINYLLIFKRIFEVIYDKRYKYYGIVKMRIKEWRLSDV